MHSIESSVQVLIVDRDVAGVEPLRMGLSTAGFVVRAITDRLAAMAAIVERPPQLVIVDWDLPGSGGPDLVTAVRAVACGGDGARHGIGLIILSALSTEHDVINGLGLGADDYIAKPYSAREVVARAQAVLRQRQRRKTRQISLVCGVLALDSETMSATASRLPLNLSPVEYRLLEFLMTHPGRAFNRAQLLAEVWGDAGAIDERTVDVNVQRLRKLLALPGCSTYIQTVRGFGYRFDTPSQVSSI